MSADVVDDAEHTTLINNMTLRDWRHHQTRDPIIESFLRTLTQGRRPSIQTIPRSSEAMSLYREFDHLKQHRGVLYRSTVVDGEDKLQLVLPAKFRETALRGLHDDTGHMGRNRTLTLLRDRFYWPSNEKRVKEWIKTCDRCIRRKGQNNIRAPLVNIATSQPLEIVCLDFLTLETSKGGYQNILVIHRSFSTRYAQAIPTRNQTARTTAEALFNNFIIHYGFTQRLHYVPLPASVSPEPRLTIRWAMG